MAKLQAHVRKSREQGYEAGFDQWYDTLVQNTSDGTNGLPAVNDLLKAVRRAGGYRKSTHDFKNRDKAVQFYCNKYADVIGDVPAVVTPKRTRTARKAATQAQATTTTPTGDLAEQFRLFQQFQALQRGETLDTDDTEDDDFEDTIPEADTTPARSERRNVRNVRRDTRSTTEASAEAFPPPRNPDDPATSGKLWKINAEGPESGVYLCVINEDGDILAGGDDPITAGEAYQIIGEHIVGNLA